MKFFDSFWKRSFYQGGKATSFWQAFGRLIFVSSIVGVLYACYFYLSFGMSIPSYLYTYGLKALNGYPSQLVLSVEDDVFSKNIPGMLQLYPIPPHGTINSLKIEDILPGYVIALNDQESASHDAYARANALILLAKDGIVTRNEREEHIMSYGELLGTSERVVVTKDMVGDMVAAVNAHASSIPKILFVAIIIASVIMLPIVYLVFALVLAGVVMLFGKKIFLRKVSYGESYVYSLYALAPIVLFIEVITLLPYIGAVIAVIPLLKIFAVLWFLWYMFRTVEKSSVTKNPEVKTKSKEPKDDDVVIPKKAVSKKSKKSTIALDAATVPLTISVKPEKKSAKKNKKTIS